jgi:hypothetical protein
MATRRLDAPPPPHRTVQVALALVLALVAALALRQVSGGDVGFHLAAGERVLDGQGLPHTDPFTFTVPDHAYVNTSWGYQVVLALLERAFGAPGLVLFHVALVLGFWGTLCATARLGPGDPVALLALVALGGLAAEMRYEVRPEVLSYTLLGLLLHLLHRHAEGRRAALWLLPLMFLVWANCHSLFVLGWLALGCFGIGLWLRDGRLDRRLSAWSLAGVAATFVNAHGWHGVAFPFTLLTRFESDNPFNQTIGEFVSPFKLGLSEPFPFYPRLPIVCFRVYCVLVLLSLVPLARQRRWHCLLLALPFGYLACTMVRNMPLLVVTALPGSCWGLAGPIRRVAQRLQAGRVGAAVAVVALVLILRVVHDSYYITSRRQERFGLGWNERALPIAATAYAERAGLWGPVLNHLNFGGYLIWARKLPVFIDGRLEVMGETFFERYRRTLASPVEREAAVARHGIEWTIFPYRTNASLVEALHGDERWRLAYVDGVAAIWVRADRASATTLDPSAMRPRGGPPALTDDLPGVGDSPRRGPIARWLRGLVRRERFPDESFHLGLFDYFRGDPAGAALRFAEAIRQSDGAYFETYLNLGSALFRQGRLREARDCYRVVLEDAPDNRVARERLLEIERRLAGR